jgi:hypothetical protein
MKNPVDMLQQVLQRGAHDITLDFVDSRMGLHLWHRRPDTDQRAVLCACRQKLGALLAYQARTGDQDLYQMPNPPSDFPPSTNSVWPVMNAASGLASQTTAESFLSFIDITSIRLWIRLLST